MSSVATGYSDFVLCAPAEAQAARLMPPPQGRSPRASAGAARTVSVTASAQPSVPPSTGSGSLGGQAEPQLWGPSSLGGQAGGALAGSGTLSSQGSLLPSFSMDAFIRDMLLAGVATDAAAAAEASRALSRDVGSESAGAEAGRSQAAAGWHDAAAVHLCCITQVLHSQQHALCSVALRVQVQKHSPHRQPAGGQDARAHDVCCTYFGGSALLDAIRAGIKGASLPHLGAGKQIGSAVKWQPTCSMPMLQRLTLLRLLLIHTVVCLQGAGLTQQPAEGLSCLAPLLSEFRCCK